MFGAYFAWEMGVPLVASWHTNVHEYAARRMGWLTEHVSERRGAAIESGVEARLCGPRRSFINWRLFSLRQTVSFAACWRRRREGRAS